MFEVSLQVSQNQVRRSAGRADHCAHSSMCQSKVRATCSAKANRAPSLSVRIPLGESRRPRLTLLRRQRPLRRTTWPRNGTNRMSRGATRRRASSSTGSPASVFTWPIASVLCPRSSGRESDLGAPRRVHCRCRCRRCARLPHRRADLRPHRRRPPGRGKRADDCRAAAQWTPLRSRLHQCRRARRRAYSHRQPRRSRRCGHSENKPFCDLSHRAFNFQA